MGSDQFLRPEDEQDEANRRIEEIRRGGSTSASGRAASYEEEAQEGYESEAVSRARGRAAAARARLGLGAEPESRARKPASRAGTRSGISALTMIGGLVGLGIVIVIILVLVAQAASGGGLAIPLFATKTPTPTPTPPATETPTPTLTLTPTRPAPNLALPPLTCIFQSGTGCFDYCQQPANLSECNSAKDFVRAQGADPDVWLTCLAPGPGPNQGNPQDCLRQAWYAANP